MLLKKPIHGNCLVPYYCTNSAATKAAISLRVL